MYDEETKIIIESKDYIKIKDKYKKIVSKRIYYNFKINLKYIKFLFIIFLYFYICCNKSFFTLNLNKKLLDKSSNKDKLSNNKIDNITKIFESTNNMNRNDSFIINKNIYTLIDNLINKQSLYNGNSLFNKEIFKNNSYLLFYQNNIINNHINFNLQKNMNNLTTNKINSPF